MKLLRRMWDARRCRVCDDRWDAHAHYRAGTECSASGCLCPAFVWRWSW